jgi:hypothetical protein
MANTNILIFYIFFLVIFNFFAASFALSADSRNFNLSEQIPLSELRIKIQNLISRISDSESIIDNALTDLIDAIALMALYPVLFVVVVFAYILFLLNMILIGVAALPAVVNILLFTPMGIIIVYDYVLPYLRG